MVRLKHRLESDLAIESAVKKKFKPFDSVTPLLKICSSKKIILSTEESVSVIAQIA